MCSVTSQQRQENAGNDAIRSPVSFQLFLDLDAYRGKMEMMLMLLTLVMLAIFIPSSQAYRCYSCSSILDSNCITPTTATDTCTGDSCFKLKSESAGGTTTVVRGCYSTSRSSTVGCESASASGITSHSCVCESNLCNGGGFSEDDLRLRADAAMPTPTQNLDVCKRQKMVQRPACATAIPINAIWR